MGDTSEALGVVVGATIIFVVGLVNDLREVSGPAKVAGQVLADGVLSLLGVTLGRHEMRTQPSAPQPPVSVL